MLNFKFQYLAQAALAGFVVAAALALVPSGGLASLRANGEALYLAESDAAMKRMMRGMAIKPTGDVDRDFVNAMVPHHQGAIDMAIAVLRYGHNEKIRRLAQEIIIDQQQEIVAMRRAVGEAMPEPSSAPTQVRGAADSRAMPPNMK